MIVEEPVNLSAVALEDMEVCFIPKPKSWGSLIKQSVFNECDENDMWSERLKTVKEGLAMLTCFIYMKPLGKTR
jgi:hypothetical protein